MDINAHPQESEARNAPRFLAISDVHRKSVNSLRLFQQTPEKRPVVANRWCVRFVGCGQLVINRRPSLISQMVVTDAQLDAGEIAVAIRRDKRAPAVIPGTGQGQGDRKSTRLNSSHMA